jgi:hypothetical protein
MSKQQPKQPAPKTNPPKQNPNLPSKNPGHKSGPKRGNNPPKK